jgi:Raf kinase inhibitor-like YbhB/YbcL family protein
VIVLPAAVLFLGFTLTSPAFGSGALIPARYTCAGADVSPPLRWSVPPPGTRSLSLTVQDPDAKNFVHWRAWGIAARTRSLAAGAHPPHEGLNGFGKRGWGGPCPAPGPTHHYVFVLKALDGHGRVLNEAGLIARYKR